MTQEQKQTFTLRLSQSNRSGVILIMYEIIFTHLDDAIKALTEGNREEYKKSIHMAQAMLKELEAVLDFKYSLSKNLYSLYAYCRKELSLSMMSGKEDGICNARKTLERLYGSFVEVAKQDHSLPMMTNTQNVYAGMTYGRKSIDSFVDMDLGRGYLA